MNIVSFSGGRTSAYMCKVLLDLYPRNELEFIFMDTGAEHPKTYEFIKNCDKHFGLNLKVLKPIVNPEMGKGMDYKIITTNEMGWDLSVMKSLVIKYGTFDYLNAICTTMLKTRTASKYLSKYNKKEITQWIGIRIDEKRRLKDKKGFKYLAEVSNMEKSDIIQWWSEQEFNLELDQHLGNCIFCVKKNVNYIGLAQKDEPELFHEWSEMIASARQRTEYDKNAIYRGKVTPSGIIEMYKDFTYQEMKQQLRMYKDKTVCSDSCEAYQMELF